MPSYRPINDGNTNPHTNNQGHREFPFGKLKIPPRYYTKFPKIPGDPITSYRPPTGSQSTLNEAFDRGMEKDRDRDCPVKTE